MKGKKVLIIVIIIIVIIALFLISLFIGKSFSKTDNTDTNISNVENISNETTQEVYENIAPKNEEEREYTNIVTNSKIGIELQELINISNIYSEEFFKILDVNSSITDDAKRIFVYSRFVTDEDYKSDIRYSENYLGSYVTKNDFDEVAKKFFGSTTELEGKSVISEENYDAENKNYVIAPLGICGNDVHFTLDVPYKMLEYEDRTEIYVYRLYIIQNAFSEGDESENSLISRDNVYSDPERKNLIFTLTDGTLNDQATQTYNMLEKINSLSVDTSILRQGIYTIKEENNNKYIESYKNI